MQMQAIPERYNRIYVPFIRCIGEQPFPLLHLPPASGSINHRGLYRSLGLCTPGTYS